MKALKESILDTDELDLNFQAMEVMDELARRYGLRDGYRRSCQYGLIGHTMSLKTRNGAPVLDEGFVSAMKKLKVTKLDWDVDGCSPKLRGNWDIDINITNGHIGIMRGSISGELHCDGALHVFGDTEFKHTQVTCSALCIEENAVAKFTNNSVVYTEEVYIHGKYPSKPKTDVHDTLFVTELEKLGAITIFYNSIRDNFKSNPDLTLKKICGKTFPNVKNINMINIGSVNMYIGKTHTAADTYHHYKVLELKDGNKIWLEQA